MIRPSEPTAVNLRRLMADLNLTIAQVVEASGLDERTIKAILNGSHKPHARTLHQLARGLDVPPGELFLDPARLIHQVRRFDRQTNPMVDEAIDARPGLFGGWTEADFDELHSRFGTGGGLTVEGALEAARAMNQKRDIQRKVALLLETGEGRLLCELVEVLYRRVVVEKE
ncbi:MAG: helix-turn-helix domain-containing protein [Pirellulales bacterium]